MFFPFFKVDLTQITILSLLKIKILLKDNKPEKVHFLIGIYGRIEMLVKEKLIPRIWGKVNYARRERFQTYHFSKIIFKITSPSIAIPSPFLPSKKKNK